MTEAVDPEESKLPAVELFIVNYAGGEKLIRCVESILDSDYPDLRVRIIENDSRDSALHAVRLKYPGVDIIELPRNMGYAGAFHVAAERCESELLIICNNDLVFDASCVRKLVETMRSSGASSVSARIINPDESPLEYGYNASLNPLFFLIHGVFEERTRAVYPSGACFLIEKEALAENLPPKEFFLYYEDLFLGMAMRISGMNIIQANDAIVRHEQGHSVSRMSRHALTFYRVRNRLTCMRVFLGRGTRFKLSGLAPLVILFHLREAIRGNESFPAVLSAWLHSVSSINFKDRIRSKYGKLLSNGEGICAEYFTSRLLPDEAPYAALINRFSRFYHRLLRIRTYD